MTEVRARFAAETLVERIHSLEKEGVRVNLTSCCCREAIRVTSGGKSVEIQEDPSGWEIVDV